MGLCVFGGILGNVYGCSVGGPGCNLERVSKVR